MVKKFSGRTRAELSEFIRKYINLLNIDEYNIPKMRAWVDYLEKIDKRKRELENKRKRELEQKEKEEKERAEKEKENALYDSDNEEKSTELNTKELDNVYEEETESMPTLFDLTKANEYRPNNKICSDDELSLSESISQIGQNK